MTRACAFHRIACCLLLAASVAACERRVQVAGPPDASREGSPAGQSAASPAKAAAAPAGATPAAQAAVPEGAPAAQAAAPEGAPAAPDGAGAQAAQSAELARPAKCGGGVPPLKLTLVASGLDQPTYVAAPPGDPARLVVLEKAGIIRLIKDGAVQQAPFLDARSRVYFPAPNAEGGLLGLAFHPDYAKNGRFWLHYSSAPRGNVVIDEWKRGAQGGDAAHPEPVRSLVDVKHSAWNHVGGMLAFGKDGFLYAAIGDSARSPSPAPDLTSKLGKILRINVDEPSRPPAGNMTGGDPLIWDYGLRNPWRFSFDRLTGDMYIGDVGQKSWEEILVERPGQGRNDYGWDAMEGSHCYPPGSTCKPRGVLPVVEHPRSEAGSIVGGYVYRGAKIPCLRGRYIYADYVTGRFFSFVWDGKAATDRVELTSALSPNGLPSSFGEDAAGEIYVVMFNTGRLYRLDPG
ncbi:PQQ-dependent sugar dehydrogenase [Sorangium sp. So ce1024]|uniref:PQQ-dependent sugar dehydrogenase n=1 Tax=unclassified Sorangium TaxID=2621164 RepID=UPI003F000EDD